MRERERARERALLEAGESEQRLVPASISGAGALGSTGTLGFTGTLGSSGTRGSTGEVGESALVAADVTLAAALTSEPVGDSDAVRDEATLRASDALPRSRRARRLAEQLPAADQNDENEPESNSAAEAAAEIFARLEIKPLADAPLETPQVTPAFVSRRALRERSAPQPTLAKGPLGTDDVVASVARPSRSRAAVRAYGRNAFSIAAMAFVAAMALATSVPANALLSPDDVAAQKVQTRNVSASSSQPAAQSLTGDGASVAPVERDTFSAKSLEEVVALSNMQTASTFTNDPNGTIQWPFPVGVPITDTFGYRDYPAPGMHHGVDFVPGAGTPIHNIADGVVRYVGTNSNASLGIHVIVDHQINGQLVSSVYAHMQVGTVQVEEGQHVKVTDVLGKVGSTGFSTGAHLHFEIRVNGTDYVDPFAWMQQHAN